MSPARFRSKAKDALVGDNNARGVGGSSKVGGSSNKHNNSKDVVVVPPQNNGGPGTVTGAGAGVLVGGGGMGLGAAASFAASAVGSAAMLVRGGRSHSRSSSSSSNSSIPVAAAASAAAAAAVGIAAVAGAHSLRESKEKLEKLVKVFGPESRDEIWEAMTHSMAAGNSGSGSVPAVANADVPTSTAATSTLPMNLESGSSGAGSPGARLGGMIGRRTSSARASGGFDFSGKGTVSPGGRWGADSSGIYGGGVGGMGGFGKWGGGLGGGSVKSTMKSSKFAYRKRLREGLDDAYRSESFCTKYTVAFFLLRGILLSRELILLLNCVLLMSSTVKM